MNEKSNFFVNGATDFTIFSHGFSNIIFWFLGFSFVAFVVWYLYENY